MQTKQWFKKVIVCGILMMSGILCAASDTLIGTYACKGYDPVKPEVYTGSLRISLLNNRIYQLEWSLDNSEKEQFKGKGLLQREVLSVIYQDVHQEPHDLQGYGLQIYRIQPDHKTISGEWFYLSNEKIGHEECTRTSS